MRFRRQSERDWGSIYDSIYCKEGLWRAKIMLNIIFNRGTKNIEDKNYVFSPDTYFKYNYEEEWF